MFKFKLLSRTAAVACALAAAPQAQAITFILNSTINTNTFAGSRAQAGFQTAAAYWSSVLTDNSTVRLNIGFNSLGAGVLGQAGSATGGLSVLGAYNALRADATSGIDAIAMANLRPLGPNANNPAVLSSLTVIANAFNATNTAYSSTATRVDSDGSGNNRTLDINLANAKALGFADPGVADGTIEFSSDFSFDFDPSNGISGNQIDFLGVAIHEIGHVLGFVSGVDTYDAVSNPNGPAPQTIEQFRVASVLDLYRYSSAGNLDWSTVNQSYFSVDGGLSGVYGDARFSRGQFNGDGRQASHFKDGAGIGIMDPTFSFGEQGVVSSRDLAAFDAIGYNLAVGARDNAAYRATTGDIFRQFAVAPVPEPATWALMIAGFGMVGGSMRTQRRRVSVRFAA